MALVWKKKSSSFISKETLVPYFQLNSLVGILLGQGMFFDLNFEITTILSQSFRLIIQLLINLKDTPLKVGWWLVAGGWRLVAGDWRLVVGG